ncbi:MAG: GntR family transcriptional regulator [Clostridiales bacterium GWF2_38_85]|nr:MAG: GntR family transcriptional regulator [Clostridiales bacterium GWF2_38_85]HBL84093.1 PLP-dependent aminotransferase family protein [Clostridiales bacterium]
MYIFSDKVKDMKPSAIREIFKSMNDPDMISLAAGNPSAESFPYDKMASISQEIFEQTPVLALQYSITEGYPKLISHVTNRLKNKFNIDTENDEIIITSGGQQGIDLSAKVLCNEGDTVICEKPSFIGALNAFRSYNTKLVGINIDSDGINIEELEDALKTTPNVKLIYVIPTFQNPTGICMSLDKRKKVLELAEKYNVMILEDNPYGELRFDGEDISTIKSFDKSGRVIYCSTFSKILSAGMRVGYVCGPKEIIQKIVVVKQVNDVHTNIFFQILCSRFMNEYDIDQHIIGIKQIYRRKCGLMLSELDKHLSDMLDYTRPQGGLFLWATAKNGESGIEIAKRAAENKVAVVPGNTFLTNVNEFCPSFRLNYSTPSDEQIIRGIERLEKTLRTK